MSSSALIMSLIAVIFFQIIVEGNIGAGKSTFLKHLAEFYSDKIKCYPEPVHLWRDLNGINLLSMMYENPKRWAFTLQQYITLTMVMYRDQVDSDQNSKPVAVMERSIYSARYCFVELLRKKYDIL